MHIHTHVNMCEHVQRLFFPFSGQPCISDDEEIKEVDLPELEVDSECSQPVLPENAFIWVSILTFTFILKYKNKTLEKHAFSFHWSYYFSISIIFVIFTR